MKRNKYSNMMRKGLIGLFLIMMPCFTGCRIAYLLHAARGQFHLQHNSVPIEEALGRDSLGPEQKDRLRLVARIKEFGEKELGLRKTGNYQDVYLNSDAYPIFCVSACPKDRLERITWWFPVVGDMPYLGFFDLENAKAEKQRLSEKGLDVVIGAADSYSTLGWFRDPVTMNLIDGNSTGLVEIILHEMTHSTLYVNGQGEFNEGLAVLVGKVGAYRFLLKTFGPIHPFTIEAMGSLQDERLFCSLLNSLIDRLEHLYDSPLNYREKVFRREQIFKEWLDFFESHKANFRTGRFVRFGSGGLNNAYLMTAGLYHRRFRLFESVLKQKGNSVRTMLAFFRELSISDKDMLEMTREWLNRGQFTALEQD